VADNAAPGFEIKCDGAALAQETAGAVIEIMAESRLEWPCVFAITLNDKTLSAIDPKNGKFRDGARVEIALGYESKFQTLITGEVSAVSAEMSAKGVYARVSGFDMLHRLARGTNYRVYESGSGDAMTDSSIAKDLLNAAGLRPTVDETPDRNAIRIQDNRSDLDFLTMLANLNGYYLYNEGDRAFFMDSPPDRGEVTLTWGKNLRSFYPRLNLSGRVNTLEVRGRDVARDENFFETIDRPREELLVLSSAGRDMMERGSGGRSALSLHDPLIASGNDAKRFLAGALRQRQGLAEASGTCAGNTALRAGAKLKIEEAGRFSGAYIVTRAVHRLSAGGYITEIEARITP